MKQMRVEKYYLKKPKEVPVKYKLEIQIQVCNSINASPQPSL